jgi:YidC/Oxa1 family membrane protein insertase
MDRRTITAVVLCFLIFFGWQKYYIEPRMAAQQQAQQLQQQAVQGSPEQAASQGQALPAQQAASAPTQTAPVSSATGEALVGNGPRFFGDWSLRNYRTSSSPDAPAVDLDAVTHEAGNVELAFDDPAFAYLSRASGQLEKTPTGVRWTYEDKDVKLTREFDTNPGSPWIPARVTANFKGAKKPGFAFLSIASRSVANDPETQDRQLLYFTNKSLERVVLKDTIAQTGLSTPVDFVAAQSRYFLLALVDESASARGLVQPLGTGAGRVSLVYPMTGGSLHFSTRVYFGPKELELLRATDPRLDHTVDLGWFTFVAYPLLWVLKWLYKVVHNYGVAIIILTILLKIGTYPLTYKSMKSMREMAKLQPQMARLREKHKDDREALNREMMVLMKTHGYNPMAGCLPMLITMPVFIALYRVLYSSIELLHAPFALWIHDLSLRDPFYVTPVLLTVTMFLQSKMTPNTATDPAQQKMMQFMPLIFGAMMVTLPSGLTLYMLVNTLSGIVQQMILNRKLGGPSGAHGVHAVAGAR